jgi:hypothetical protein
MDLLDEIKRLKVRRKEIGGISRSDVENPLPRWEKVWYEVSVMVQTYCVNKRVTFGELIEECREIDPAMVDEYFRLWDLVDCDVFGRWLDNTLTEEGLKAFYGVADRWKEAMRNLLALLEQEARKREPGHKRKPSMRSPKRGFR